MSKLKKVSLLVCVFILLFPCEIILGILLFKNGFFDWDYLQPTIKLLLLLMWLTIGLSLIGLIAIFVIGKLKFNRDEIRVRLLSIVTLLCIIGLLMEVGAFLEFNGGEQCFPFNLNTHVGWKPPFLPLQVTIDSQGKISLSGDTSISFELGTFSIGGDISFPPITSNDSNVDTSTTILVIRHREGDKVVDTQYQLRSRLDSVQITSTGRTVIQITKEYFFINISQGEIESTQINITPINRSCSSPISS